MYINKQHLQRGMSLVEVFVALLVLSVGMIALAKLQVDLVRGGSDARARTIALNLAEEKIEDLRTFATVGDPGAVSWSTSANPMDWTYIDDNTGGRLPPQTTFSSTLEVAGVRFLRSWDVTDRDFTNVASGITTRTKDVTVTVSWQSETGASQPGCPVANTRCVQTIANVVDIPPGNVALASEPVSDRPDGPKVLYTPGVAPEIISVPIDTGSGRRETTKPLPDVQAQGDYAHEVRFDVVNYHLDGTDNVVDRREEFVTVNCRCALAGPGRGRTPARVSFVGNVLRDLPGEVIPNKSQTGVVKTSGTDGISQQPELCSICCRDHHDGPTVTDGSDTEYNRYNPTAGSDHQHFLMPSTTPVTAIGAAYDEACRLKRVNGVFQVFQDWKLETITALPATYLRDDSPTTQASYIQYVQNFVQAKVEGNTAPAKLTALPNRDFDFDKGGNRQLLSRSIYVDYMPPNLLTFLQNRISNSQPFLEFVPFYEINDTKLADWLLNTTTPGPATNQIPCPPTNASINNAMVVCVTNQAIVDESVSSNNYSRGLAVAGQTAGQMRVLSQSKLANTGVTGTFAISANDATTTSDYVTATVNSGITTQSISGQIDFSQCPSHLSGPDKTALYGALSISYSGPGSVTCSKDALVGNTGGWRCNNVPNVPASAVTVTPTFTPLLSRDANPANYSVTVDGTLPLNNLNFSICDVAQP